jgi:hypothetical protein
MESMRSTASSKIPFFSLTIQDNCRLAYTNPTRSSCIGRSSGGSESRQTETKDSVYVECMRVDGIGFLVATSPRQTSQVNQRTNRDLNEDHEERRKMF